MVRIGRAASYVLVAIAVLLLVGTLAPRPLVSDPGADQANRRILVISNPIHTDIAIPLDRDVLARFGPLMRAGIKADASSAHYLVFGWGSRAFYIETPTWADLKPRPLFSALTLDASVMHVGVTGVIDETKDFVRGFNVSEAAFARLLDFIEKSFEAGPYGPIWIPGSSYGDHDAFFEAKGSFTAFLGCNTWTAAALREAGLQTGWWNPMPQTLGLSLELHN